MLTRAAITASCRQAAWTAISHLLRGPLPGQQGRASMPWCVLLPLSAPRPVFILYIHPDTLGQWRDGK